MRSHPTKRWRTIAYGVAPIADGMVFKLADSAHESDGIVRSDTRIIRYVFDHRTPLLSSVARVVTHLGSGWIVVLSVTALLFTRGTSDGVVRQVFDQVSGTVLFSDRGTES